MSETTLLQYPIGRFEWQTQLSKKSRVEAMKTLAAFPNKLETLLNTFPKALLEKRYRPNGWTATQVIHHLADSHMHSFLRCKHALLESTPHIKDYQEKDWANTPDATEASVKFSISLLAALHKRWVVFFEALNEDDFQKVYYHPERDKNYPLDTVLALYAWHGEHHLAHLQNIIKNPFD